jgi:hypothetical protein
MRYHTFCRKLIGFRGRCIRGSKRESYALTQSYQLLIVSQETVISRQNFFQINRGENRFYVKNFRRIEGLMVAVISRNLVNRFLGTVGSFSGVCSRIRFGPL